MCYRMDFITLFCPSSVIGRRELFSVVSFQLDWKAEGYLNPLLTLSQCNVLPGAHAQVHCTKEDHSGALPLMHSGRRGRSLGARSGHWTDGIHFSSWRDGQLLNKCKGPRRCSRSVRAVGQPVANTKTVRSLSLSCRASSPRQRYWHHMWAGCGRLVSVRFWLQGSGGGALAERQKDTARHTDAVTDIHGWLQVRTGFFMES